MNIGIVGSRTFTDDKLMDRAYLDTVGPLVSAIVSGGAIGADTLASVMARRWGIPLIEHLPDLDRYGSPQAYFRRNTLIVGDSDMLLAFFGPDEPAGLYKGGTMDSVRKAIAKRIPVYLFFQS